MTVRMLGMAQTQAALTKARLQVEAASPMAVRAAANVVRLNMIARAPRDTGRLVRSISVDVDDTAGGATAKIGADVPYDRFVQKGTVYMAPQTYGEDAGDASVGGIVAAMVGVFKAALRF